MNKNAKTNMWMVLLIIVGLVVAGALIYGQFSQSQAGTQQAQALTEVAEGCELDPTLDWTVVDTINPGTSVSGTGPVAIVNGVYKGLVSTSTKFAKGDSVELLINGTGYISKAIAPITASCGINSVQAELVKLDGSPSVKVFNDDGNRLTNDANGGVTNQSSSASPITIEMRLTAPADEGIDSAVIVIESSNTTEVDDIILSSESATVEKVSKPEVHSAESSSNDEIIKAFRVTNIADDGATTTFNINIQPESGQTMGTGDNTVYITWYIEQDFIDTDGIFQLGVEDADGTAKHVSAASDDYDFSIGNE
jgi:hypothetical protein